MKSAFVAQPYTPWGRVIRRDHLLAKPRYRDEVPGLIAEAKAQGDFVLGAGLGRSYGDSGLNPDGRMICGSALDRFIALDLERGVLRAEGGASLDDVLRLVVPHGWFLPTTPGTRFVTLGGAVANDVHGKNHHLAGSIGCHIRAISLIRSDRGGLVLTAQQEPALFFATLGGLGLTGFIEWVELQLVRIPSGFLDQEAVVYSGLEGYFDLVEDSNARFEHVAAWIDCAATGPALGRGVMFRGNWSSDGGLVPHQTRLKLRIPIEAPGWVLNRLSVKAFNALTYGLQSAKREPRRVSYASAFYPLDSVGDFNRLYGPAGFFQHQSVVPTGAERQTMREMLKLIAASGQGSFLAVLKSLGACDSGGLVSFPMPGASLALDFQNRGDGTLALLERLDRIVSEAGGRVYAAKDGRMSADTFRAGYPNWGRLETLRDPLFQSAFWRRMSQ